MLNLVCYDFKDLCIYVDQGNWVCNFLWSDISVCFWKQGNVGLRETAQDYFFDFLEELEAESSVSSLKVWCKNSQNPSGSGVFIWGGRKITMSVIGLCVFFITNWFVHVFYFFLIYSWEVVDSKILIISSRFPNFVVHSSTFFCICVVSFIIPHLSFLIYQF